MKTIEIDTFLTFQFVSRPTFPRMVLSSPLSFRMPAARKIPIRLTCMSMTLSKSRF